MDVKRAADLYGQGWSLRQIAAELVLTCSYESCALEFESLASSSVLDSCG